MKNGVYYLNNSGSRWIALDENGEKEKLVILKDNNSPFSDPAIIRTALYYESFGNFAAVCYSYKGKKYSTLSYVTIEHVKENYRPFEFLFSGYSDFFSGTQNPTVWVSVYGKKITCKELYKELQNEINSTFDHIVHSYMCVSEKSEFFADIEMQNRTNEALARFLVDNIHQWNELAWETDEKPNPEFPNSLVFGVPF